MKNQKTTHLWCLSHLHITRPCPQQHVHCSVNRPNLAVSMLKKNRDACPAVIDISISVHIDTVYHLHNWNQSLDFVRVSFYSASKTARRFFCSLLAGNLSVLTVPRSLFPSIKSIFVEDSHLIMGRPKHPDLASLPTATNPMPASYIQACPSHTKNPGQVGWVIATALPLKPTNQISHIWHHCQPI